MRPTAHSRQKQQSNCRLIALREKIIRGQLQERPHLLKRVGLPLFY